MRHDMIRKTTVRFLYSDMSHPLRVTHYHVSSTDQLYIVRYDREGFIFALETQSREEPWTVACDHVGTPVAILEEYEVYKALRYSPLGELLVDTNPDFYFPFGYRGGLHDPDTGLVHFGDISLLEARVFPIFSESNNPDVATLNNDQIFAGVDYDPVVGHCTSPNIDWIRAANVEAFPFRPYQISSPTYQIRSDYHMTRVRGWLDKLGFKLNNVVPDIQITSRQKDKSSAECQLTHHLSSYMNLELFTPSVLLSRTAYEPNTVPSDALFVKDIVISIDKGLVTTYVNDDARADIKRVSNVINKAQVLIGRLADSSQAATSLRRDGNDCIYLYKEAASFNKDVQTLRLAQGSSKGPFDGMTTSLHQNRVTIKTDYTMLVIAYVGEDDKQVSGHEVKFLTMEDEYKRVMDDCHDRAAQHAWSREAEKIKTGQKTRWTVSEKSRIQHGGRLDNYVVKNKWNPDQYPELAGSGRNVIFERKSNS